METGQLAERRKKHQVSPTRNPDAAPQTGITPWGHPKELSMHEPVTPKKKGPRHLYRLRVAENLISAYVNLPENGREYVEHFLALQVYGDAGMGHYTPGSNRHRVESVDQHVMCECVKMTVHEPWSKWAKMITKANLWEFERREAVREMLGALICQKNKSCLNDSELREAAEKALEWTRWDEDNRARSRVGNSPEYKSCLKAIASGKDRKEVLKQYSVLLSRAWIQH
jgi:hypothetical protein